MSALEKTYLTPEQYLEIERKADFRSEYYSGEMFAMAGATEPHILIVSNLVIELGLQLRKRPCRVYSTDMRVRVNAAGLYTYPDVVAICGEPRFADEKRDLLLNPLVIVEVLSPSTEAYDRGEKFAQYRRLDSLTDYLLVSQDKMRVEHYVRQPDSHWLLSEASGPDARVEIAALKCNLLLADVYDKVEFSLKEAAR